MRFPSCLLVVILSTLSLVGAQAIVLFQVDDFSAGTANWTNGANSPAVVDTGFAGGPYLSNSSDGLGRRGRQLLFNDIQWTGDYLGAGVTGITFDAQSTGVAGINFRFALNGAGGWFITSAVPIPSVVAGTELDSFFLSLAEEDLIPIPGTGTGDVVSTLSDVIRVEILSAAGIPATGISPTVLQGDEIVSTLLVDNIRAIPEPGGAVLCLFSGFLCLGRRR